MVIMPSEKISLEKSLLGCNVEDVLRWAGIRQASCRTVVRSSTSLFPLQSYSSSMQRAVPPSSGILKADARLTKSPGSLEGRCRTARRGS